jgi:hypothetical protein
MNVDCTQRRKRVNILRNTNAIFFFTFPQITNYGVINFLQPGIQLGNLPRTENGKHKLF